MDAPDTFPMSSMSSATMPPMATPPNPRRPLVYTTYNMTPISMADASTSVGNVTATGRSRFGTFAPRLASVPMKAMTNSEPSTAPTISADRYHASWPLFVCPVT